MSEKCLCLWSHVAGLLPRPYIVDPNCPFHNREPVTYPDIPAITPTHEEFAELVKNHRPPPEWYEGEMERPW